MGLFLSLDNNIMIEKEYSSPIQIDKRKDGSQKELAQGEIDFDPDSPNQKIFNLADVKPLDLKGYWLGNTDEVIKNYENKLQELNKEKTLMKEGFDKFAQNEHRFIISSKRKIIFHFDKKALIQEFMQKSRRPIEKLHPSLVIRIYSYIEENIFVTMARMRRVSKIYNFIYHNQQVSTFFSQKDFGVNYILLKTQERWAKKYVGFTQTFLYYKAINYTVLIPQNSFKQDLAKAVGFISDVYKKVFEVKSTQIGYFQFINKFMKIHRAPIALQSLSFSDLAVTRRASIIAFSNYLAFNPQSRLKQEITKTKYLKMIQVVQGEDCHDALVVNSKISNFLIQQYGYEFAVFVDTLKGPPTIKFEDQPLFDLVIFHYHNSQQSFFIKGLTLQNGKVEVDGVTLEFSEDLKGCRMGYNLGQRYQKQYLMYNYMPTVGKNTQFGHCHIYRGEIYYILLIKTQKEEQESIL